MQTVVETPDYLASATEVGLTEDEHAQGVADVSRYRIHVPVEVDVKAVRRELGLSQAEFAARFGFTAARIRDWEQGRSKPDGAVRAYLLVIEREPKAVERALNAA